MVSVIIPVFNGEKYIQTIVNCFKKQIYNDFELIFVDDGSKDNSLELLNTIKNNSILNITVVTQQNLGVSVARNTGIKNAKGDLICFCDVDDEVMVNYLSDMKYVIMKNDVDLVICKNRLIQIDGTEIDFLSNQGTGNIVIKDTISSLRDYLYGRMISGCCTIMVKKELLTNNKLWFADGYKYSEDLHMVWRIIACSQKTAYLDKKLYIYKLQQNSATSVFNTERLHGYELIKSLENFFEEHSPQFSDEYKKYGASKTMWSITWQFSANYGLKEFIDFINKYNVKKEMKKLTTFVNRKVALSALIFLISPTIFRYLAIRYGKKYIH